MAVSRKQSIDLDLDHTKLEISDYDFDPANPNTYLSGYRDTTIDETSLNTVSKTTAGHLEQTINIQNSSSGDSSIRVKSWETDANYGSQANLVVGTKVSQFDMGGSTEHFQLQITDDPVASGGATTSANVLMTAKVKEAFKTVLGLPQQPQVPISMGSSIIGNVTLPASDLGTCIPLYYSTGYDISTTIFNFDNITGTGFFYLQVRVGSLPPGSTGYPTITFPNGTATQYVSGTHTFLIDNLTTVWTVTEITKDTLTLPDFSTFATKFTEYVQQNNIPVFGQTTPVQWSPATITFQNFTSASDVYTSGDIVKFENGQVIGYNFSNSSVVYGFKNTSGPPGFQSGYITLATVTPGNTQVSWRVSSLDISAAGKCIQIYSSAIIDLYTQNMFVSGLIPQLFDLQDVYDAIPEPSIMEKTYTGNLGAGTWIKVAEITDTNIVGDNPYWAFDMTFIPDRPQIENITNPTVNGTPEQMCRISANCVWKGRDTSKPGNMDIIASINSTLRNSDNAVVTTHFYYGETSASGYPCFYTKFDVAGKVYFKLTSVSDNFKNHFNLTLTGSIGTPPWVNGYGEAKYVYNDYNASDAYWLELDRLEIGLSMYAQHIILKDPQNENFSDTAQIIIEDTVNNTEQIVITMIGLGQTYVGVDGNTYGEKNIIVDYTTYSPAFSGTYVIWAKDKVGADAGVVDTGGLDLHINANSTITRLINFQKLNTQNAFRFIKKYTTRTLQRVMGSGIDLDTVHRSSIVEAINEVYDEATDIIDDTPYVDTYPLGTFVYPHEVRFQLDLGDGSDYTLGTGVYEEEWSSVNPSTGITSVWGGFKFDFDLGNLTVIENGQSKDIIKNHKPTVASPYVMLNDETLVITDHTKGTVFKDGVLDSRIKVLLKRNITTVYDDLGAIEDYDPTGLMTYTDFIAQAARDAKCVVDYTYVDSTYNDGWEGLYNYIAVKDNAQLSDFTGTALNNFQIIYTDDWSWGVVKNSTFVGIYICPGRIDFEFPDGSKTTSTVERKYIWSVGNNPDATCVNGQYEGFNPDFQFLFQNYPYMWHKEILDGSYQEYTVFPMFWLQLNKEQGFLTFQKYIAGVCDLTNTPIKYLITYNAETNSIMHGDHAALQTPSASSTTSMNGKMVDLVGVTNTLYDMTGVATVVPLNIWTSQGGSPSGPPTTKQANTVIPNQTMVRLDFSATVTTNRDVPYLWKLTDINGDSWELEVQMIWNNSSYSDSWIYLKKTSGTGQGQTVLYDGAEKVAWIHIPNSTVMYCMLPKVLWGGTIESMNAYPIRSSYSQTGPLPAIRLDQGPSNHYNIFGLCSINGLRYWLMTAFSAGLLYQYTPKAQLLQSYPSLSTISEDVYLSKIAFIENNAGSGIRARYINKHYKGYLKVISTTAKPFTDSMLQISIDIYDKSLGQIYTSVVQFIPLVNNAYIIPIDTFAPANLADSSYDGFQFELQIRLAVSMNSSNMQTVDGAAREVYRINQPYGYVD